MIKGEQKVGVQEERGSCQTWEEMITTIIAIQCGIPF